MLLKTLKLDRLIKKTQFNNFKQIKNYNYQNLSVLQSAVINNGNRYFILQNVKRLQTFSVPQQKQIQLIDKKIFNQAALKKLIHIEDAFCKIQQFNSNIIKKIDKKSLYNLQVTTNIGSFIFIADDQLSTLFYTSPFSGVYKYYYQIQQDRFLNNKDQHILDQCLSRQVLDKIKYILQL